MTIKKHIEAYAHDYRGIIMKQIVLSDILTRFKNEIKKDLLEIADKGEHEDLRREVEDYF